MPSNDSMIGKIIAGRYRIQESIGHGGMASVYRAEHLVMNRPVALKILSKDLSLDESSQKRFLAEAKIASQMHHPHAVIVYDAGVEEDTPYLVMELVTGRTLKDVIRSPGAFAPERVVRIMEQVCSALAEAHDLRIIHRDLKPSNIMLTEAGTPNEKVKVLDFGIAKALNPGAEMPTGLTMVGTLVGTPHYMSPEQGLNKELTGCSDIYSLGVILYEMLSGELPFDGTSSVIVLIKHTQEKPRAFRELNPDLKVPPSLEGVVMKCLEKEPGKRYQTVRDLAADLHQAVFPRDEVTQTVSYTPPAAKSRRNAVAAGVLLAVIGGGYLALGGRGGDREPPRAAVATPSPETEAELKRVQEALLAAKAAQARAEAARLAAEDNARRAMSEAQRTMKMQEEAEALQQWQADEARRLADEAAEQAGDEAVAKARREEQQRAAEQAAKEREAAERARLEADAAKKALAELEAAKREAEEQARRAQEDLRRAQEVKQRAELDARLKLEAESKRRQEIRREPAYTPTPASSPVMKVYTPAPAVTEEPPVSEATARPRRRCGPNWCP